MAVITARVARCQGRGARELTAVMRGPAARIGLIGQRSFRVYQRWHLSTSHRKPERLRHDDSNRFRQTLPSARDAIFVGKAETELCGLEVDDRAVQIVARSGTRICNYTRGSRHFSHTGQAS